ncbi:TetR/AcrR family transcriptional regulator [Tsukamurella sp. M9C]|uniref:TetR/AcrR family transcriptional regulator n=1 Tax=unclassified Tsukamurella TaxID=2633480 RepID=UPI0035ABCD2C
MRGVPPPPAARAKLLDAFVKILIEHGERAATLEAVAAEAGVSKGGLLYHFGSKKALVDGLCDWLDELVAADVELMAAAPEGAVEYYVRTSNYDDSQLDRAIVAVLRLSQAANDRAERAIRSMQDRFLATVQDQVPDEATARAVLLLGDGLYYDAALSGGRRRATDEQMAGLLAVVARMVDGAP